MTVKAILPFPADAAGQAVPCEPAPTAGGEREGANLRQLRGAVARTPDVAAAHLLLGAELAASGAVDDAESAFAEAVLLAPEGSIARFQLGLLQFTSGRVASARLTWQPLLALGPEDPLRSFVLGFVALAADRGGEALLAFEAGLARPDANAPLSADIRHVVRRLQAHLKTDAPVDSTEAATAAEGVHVLLSNYRAPR